MEEILALQRQLAAVQLEGASTRLSERNCVELVSKLSGLGLIDVVFTQSGREYLTRERLRREIGDEIELHGGRVNIVEAAALIGVDLHHVEVELAKYLTEHKDSARLIQGEVITDDYFDTAAEEVGEILQENGEGTVSMADIATKLNLPIDIATSMVESRMGSKIHGKLEAGRIYTDAYMERTKARVRGMMSGAASPTSLGDVASMLDVRVSSVWETMEVLLSSGRLQGELRGRGDRAVFTPAMYERTRTEAILSFFQSNKYVEVDRLKKMAISDVKSFVAGHLSDATLLRRIVIAKSLLEQVEDAASGTAAAASWLDALNLLPPVIDGEDAAHVLQESCRNTDTTVLERRFVVSNELIRQCRAIFEAEAEAKALEKVKTQPVDVALVASAPDDTSGSQTKKSKGRRKKGKEESTSRDVKIAASTLRPPSEEEAVKILEGVDPLKTVFAEDHLGEDGEDSGVVECVAKLLSGDLESIYARAEAFAREKLARDRAQSAALFERELIALLQKIELYSKAAETVSGEKLKEILQDHLLATTCRRVKNVAARYIAGEIASPGDDLAVALKTSTSSGIAQRHLRAIENAKTPEEFLELYDTHAEELGLPIRVGLDKKRDKALVLSTKAQLVEALAHEKDYINALCTVSALLYGQHRSTTILYVPPRALPLLADELRQFPRSESSDAFFHLHELVLKKLQREDGARPTLLSNSSEANTDNELSTAMADLKATFQR